MAPVAWWVAGCAGCLSAFPLGCVKGMTVAPTTVKSQPAKTPRRAWDLIFISSL